MDRDASQGLLAVAPQPLHDIAILFPDSGMRPSEVFEMRWEDLTWNPGMLFIPRGKTKRSRCHIPMSDRGIEALHDRRNGQIEGWVFPSDSRCGHITSALNLWDPDSGGTTR